MDILAHFQAQRMHIGLDAASKEDFLRTAASLISEANAALESNTLYQALWEREELGSTAMGSKVAIPHCKIEGLETLQLFVFTTLHPIAFGSPDGESTSLFFIILSPPQQVSLHLQTLARIAKLVRHQDFVSDALIATDSQQFVNLIQRYSAQ